MRIPQSTYRVQLNHQFPFRKLKEIIPYLSKLGIGEVYASPIFKARVKSLHGYDIVDPSQINPELGTLADFEELIAELKKHGMTWMQDIVPNHMALDSDNMMLMDIFENREDSKYFHVFDIDWNHPYENMRGRLLVPVLGKFYAQALEDGEIQLSYDEHGFKINYYQYHFPIKVGSYVQILLHKIKQLEAELAHNADLIKLLGVINLFKALANQIGDFAQSDQMRHAKAMLWQLYQGNVKVAKYIDANLRFFNSAEGGQNHYGPLDELISSQHYRLSFWKVATEEINYRRFFAISDLISVRVEDEKIFHLTHQLIQSLVAENKVQSLRVDHIDGLYDPENYLKQLSGIAPDHYIVVEKILFPNEDMPKQWLTQGTTGYDFMNIVNGVFCRTDHKNLFEDLYLSFARWKSSYEDLLCENKRTIISKHLAGNIDNLAQQIKKISSHDRMGRDITLYGLRRALVEVMAHFPIYRTYINSDAVCLSDEEYIKIAIHSAKNKIPGFVYELNFIEKFLLLQFGEETSQEDKKAWLNFVQTFQQYTGPVMAKGFEDTMLYVYNVLISLNEVGGSPEKFGFTRDEFHTFNSHRLAMTPHAMCATATHDMKRGEDVRARINVVSELPQEWDDHLRHWAQVNKGKKTQVGRVLAPDENDEYFLYQTLLGTYPFEGMSSDYLERIKSYFIKAIREAKRHTAWIKPAEQYEQACLQFIDNLLNSELDNEFLKAFSPFQRKIAAYGVWNSLSQTVLKMTSPGVPDTYQGTEFWDLTMVDPDNRRAVDYSRRERQLTNFMTQGQERLNEIISELLFNRTDDGIKLFLTNRLLMAIQEYEEVFRKGDYVPLIAEGCLHNHVIGFMRRYLNKSIVVAVPRFLCEVVTMDQCPLGNTIWGDTVFVLPAGCEGNYQDVITNQEVTISSRISVGLLFANFPASVCIVKNQ